MESTLDKADHERMVNYRKAAEEVQRWLTCVDKLNLPPNPLDRLLNELGGPDEVAELTGRKIRQVKVYDAIKDQEVVILEKRKGDGPMVRSLSYIMCRTQSVIYTRPLTHLFLFIPNQTSYYRTRSTLKRRTTSRMEPRKLPFYLKPRVPASVSKLISV